MSKEILVGTEDMALTSSTTNWDKFRLLMWKNYLLQWRHKIQSIVEIAVPIVLCGLLVFTRSMVDPDVFDKPTLFSPFRIDTLDGVR